VTSSLNDLLFLGTSNVPTDVPCVFRQSSPCGASALADCIDSNTRASTNTFRPLMNAFHAIQTPAFDTVTLSTDVAMCLHVANVGSKHKELLQWMTLLQKSCSPNEVTIGLCS